MFSPHNIKNNTKHIDSYIGKRVELQRYSNGLGSTDYRRALNISNEKLCRLEKAIKAFLLVPFLI